MRPGIGRQIAAAMRQHELQVRIILQDAAEDQVMHRDGRIERVADNVREVMVAEAAGLGKPGRVHEQDEPQLLGARENRPEARLRQIGAGDVGRDLDAAQPERFVQPVELGDGKLGRLERHRAEPDEAVRMIAADLGDIVVDDPRGGDAEIGRHAVEGLGRRRGDRLDVDPHAVHVGEPGRDVGELNAGAAGLFAIGLAGQLVGELMARLPVHRQAGALHHLLGLHGQQMAVDIDREPLAACMHRPRKTARDLRPLGQACEQHSKVPPSRCPSVPHSDTLRD